MVDRPCWLSVCSLTVRWLQLGCGLRQPLLGADPFRGSLKATRASGLRDLRGRTDFGNISFHIKLDKASSFACEDDHFSPGLPPPLPTVLDRERRQPEAATAQYWPCTPSRCWRLEGSSLSKEPYRAQVERDRLRQSHFRMNLVHRLSSCSTLVRAMSYTSSFHRNRASPTKCQHQSFRATFRALRSIRVKIQTSSFFSSSKRFLPRPQGSTKRPKELNGLLYWRSAAMRLRF